MGLLLKVLSKKNSQVSLETIMVFISLAALSIACVNVFSNLTVNELKRIDVYKNSRLAAVNNYGVSLAGRILQTPLGPRPMSDPTVFLDYFPSNEEVIDDFPPGGSFSFVFNNPYLNLYSAHLETFDRILNILLPYKANQAYWLAKNSYWDSHRWMWLPIKYLDKALELNSEINGYSRACLSIYQEAINTLRAAVQDDNSNLSDSAKESLEKTADMLEEMQPYLEMAIDEIVQPKVEFVSAYLGSINWGKDPPQPSSNHYKAIEKLEELVDFWGSIDYPFVSKDFYRKVSLIYDCIYGYAGKYSIKKAKTLTEELLESPEAESQPLLRFLLRDLDKNLEMWLDYWDQPEGDYPAQLSGLDTWIL